MFRRAIFGNILAALSDSPAVLVHGARQVGKTTLVREVASTVHPARYFTLDDATTLAAIAADPDGFVRGLGEERVVIDEVQRAPALFRALKARIDRSPRPGQFLLTGSANVLALPGLSESLAGRMEIVTLWPLAEQEIEATTDAFVDRIFSRQARWPEVPTAGPAVVDRILRGGYPEALIRTSAARRRAWFASYVTTILQRDVRDLANIEGLASLPRLLALVATRSAGLLNFSDLSRGLSIPQSTLKRYFALLEATFLIRLLPAWTSNLGLRLVKSPKLMVSDSGLCASLVGASAERLASEGTLLGSMLETFATMELVKQASWSEAAPHLFHFRTPTGHEVDVVLEDAAGRVVGIEIKATHAVTASDFKGLRVLADAAGSRFVRGIVLSLQDDVVPFGANLHAVPLAALWSS
jgi:uncharacterized protein